MLYGLDCLLKNKGLRRYTSSFVKVIHKTVARAGGETVCHLAELTTRARICSLTIGCPKQFYTDGFSNFENC